MKKAAFLATLAALSLLGIVLAYWGWAWLAPAPVARAPAAAESAGGTAAAAALFGSAKAGSSAAGSGSIRLMGVVAASGAANLPGRAVLRLDAKKTVSVLQGEDIEPGVRLAEVHVDHVVLERHGARETLAWPAKAGK